MELSDDKIKEYLNRIANSRTRILCSHGFYGLLLMHMKFGLDENFRTAATDGEITYFSPRFLDELSDSELDFVLMHEVLHVVLQHCIRHKNRDKVLFNIACDIVVNSNILHSNHMDIKSITLKKYGESMHTLPNGEEGYFYTAEQVYEHLKSTIKEKIDDASWDDHSEWGKYGEWSRIHEEWVQHLKNACKSMEARENAGLVQLPMFAKRALKEFKNPQTDWRIILNDLIQLDPTDYSFCPPDKRFPESPFLIPDFNDMQERIANVYFFVDTSASIGTDELTVAYSEIKGAIEQFNNGIQGKLAFFDSSVKEPIRDFSDVDDLVKIKPIGGGGTNFHDIFKFIKNKVKELPEMIIILTDGQASYPVQADAMGIPVLWLINNEKVTPPWGKVAKVKV